MSNGPNLAPSFRAFRAEILGKLIHGDILLSKDFKELIEVVNAHGNIGDTEPDFRNKTLHCLVQGQRFTMKKGSLHSTIKN
jgi:hypothetical protein